MYQKTKPQLKNNTMSIRPTTRVVRADTAAGRSPVGCWIPLPVDRRQHVAEGGLESAVPEWATFTLSLGMIV